MCGSSSWKKETWPALRCCPPSRDLTPEMSGENNKNTSQLPRFPQCCPWRWMSATRPALWGCLAPGSGMSNNDRLLCPWGPRAAPPPQLTPQAGKEDRTFISHFSKESKNTPHSWTFRSQSKAQGINRDSCPSPQGKRELRRQRMVFAQMLLPQCQDIQNHTHPHLQKLSSPTVGERGSEENNWNKFLWIDKLVFFF